MSIYAQAAFWTIATTPILIPIFLGIARVWKALPLWKWDALILIAKLTTVALMIVNLYMLALLILKSEQS